MWRKRQGWYKNIIRGAPYEIELKKCRDATLYIIPCNHPY